MSWVLQGVTCVVILEIKIKKIFVIVFRLTVIYQEEYATAVIVTGFLECFILFACGVVWLLYGIN